MSNETLQLINILLTSGVLLALIGAGVWCGRISQKVETHGDEIRGLRQSHSDLHDMIVGRIVKREREP